MDKKRLIGMIVGAVVLIAVILVVIMAIGLGGEASKLDAMLKQDVTSHASVDDVKKQLTDLGYQIGSSSATEISATGPHHSAIIYSSWLALTVTFNSEGKAVAEHFDRDSGWF